MAIDFDNLESNGAPSAKPKQKFSLSMTIGNPSTAKVALRDRMAFNEQLALLLETGVPLHTALGELENQTDNAVVRSIIRDVRDEVVEGATLAAAMSRHPRMFNTTYVNLVASGEAGGFLPSVLQQLMELDEKSQRLRSIIISAFSYPVILMVVSVLVVGFVLLWVFPRFAELFASLGDKLPPLTILLMKTSNGIRDYWAFILAILAMLGGFSWHALRQQQVLERLDTWLLGLPIIGPVLSQIYLVPTLRVISLSLKNGVPLVKALHAAREVTRSPAFKALMDKIAASVNEGQGLSKAFSETQFLPSLAREMTATGESTGNLAMVMAKLCDYYQRQLEQRLETLAKLAEPIMLLLMGVIVGGIVSALILPIFKLATNAH